MRHGRQQHQQLASSGFSQTEGRECLHSLPSGSNETKRKDKRQASVKVQRTAKKSRMTNNLSAPGFTVEGAVVDSLGNVGGSQ